MLGGIREKKKRAKAHRRGLASNDRSQPQTVGFPFMSHLDWPKPDSSSTSGSGAPTRNMWVSPQVPFSQTPNTVSLTPQERGTRVRLRARSRSSKLGGPPSPFPPLCCQSWSLAAWYAVLSRCRFFLVFACFCFALISVLVSVDKVDLPVVPYQLHGG